MRKFFSYIGILTLLIVVFSPVFVSAQGRENSNPCSGLSASDPQYIAAGCGGNANAAAGGVVNPKPAVYDGGSIWDILNPATWIPKALGLISYTILKIIGLVMGLAGLLLNYVITETVVKMAENISGPSFSGINVAWKVIRDLMNLAFIFLLIYEGILVIIGKSDTGKVKSFIVGIVLASILINFSLFFTKLLIDASNVVTIGFYNAIIGPEAVEKNLGLSDAFQQSIGLQGFFAEEGVETNFSKISKGGDDYAMLTIGVMGSILFLITTFVFLAVSVMFVVRYIVLIVLLMLSPIAYMGMALPEMKENASRWWASLNGQLLFGPIYMIMTWVIITLISGFQIKPDDWTSFADSGKVRDSVSLFFNFTVVIGLSIVSLVIAKQYATKGASQIGQLTGKATAFAGGALMGSASKIGRGTIGRTGNMIANSEKLKERASKGGVGGFFAKQIIKGGDKTAKSSFDVRSTGQFQNLAGATGVSFGKGADAKKVNFRGDLEAKGKKEADFAKMLKPSGAAVDKEKEKTQKPLDKNAENIKSELDNTNTELKELNKKKADLETAREKAERMSDTEEERRIAQEIKDTENQIKEKNADVKKLEELSKEAIAAAKENEKRIKNIGNARIDAYADTFAKENALWTWSKNVLKLGGGALGGAIGGGIIGAVREGATVGGLKTIGSVVTPSEKKEIARKIRKDAKEKTKKEKLADLATDVANEERKERKERGETDEKEEEKEEKPKEGETT
ncbi:MAG: hypothetical protein A3E32_03485 [Candidatus Zambryskibacteria bacterium RIFCSPHIGHO2_12_FULL_38_37]|uniref:Uncharacterized protein n=1 Tax=Candidatus Zambryskibacteria bacterium RIFCSPHIGHO2_12_FULL_38_37 TaxID=1802751 RepID=A0A1G2TPV1_9BACT|nr:MAG: hypothetical protein A3C63_02580 [Candidatus Zambryskibacteria bacterium RIFCSPHIGHO2_02_FULL_39_82]OHA99222.1 MAG: hypothetical protein A3E32_03485 [Candidatus Zambryskibacteria bacterium RIFCSPHIGHO2_12_FULL_38_37]